MCICILHIYISLSLSLYIYIYISCCCRLLGVGNLRCKCASLPALALEASFQGFQGHGVSIIRIRYIVPLMFVCIVFSCLAILRIEGCLNNTVFLDGWGLSETFRHLQAIGARESIQYSWNSLYICMYVYIYIYIHMYIGIIRMYVCIYIYIHTHTHTSFRSAKGQRGLSCCGCEASAPASAAPSLYYIL